MPEPEPTITDRAAAEAAGNLLLGAVLAEQGARMRATEQAFFAADGLAFELPDGRRVQMKALPWKRAAYYLRLYTQLVAGDTEALVKILEEWPEETQISIPLLPSEVMWLVRRFFTLRGWKEPLPTPTAPVTTAPSPAQANGS